MNIQRLHEFEFEGKKQQVTFVETLQVTSGVECDVYTFDNDTTKDLGVIRIQSGSSTPLQKVLKGDRTTEGYISGKGQLVIRRKDGKEEMGKKRWERRDGKEEMGKKRWERRDI